MKVCWKALLGYGFVFWLVLCITDFLGITKIHTYTKGTTSILTMSYFHIYIFLSHFIFLFMKQPEYFEKLVQEFDELYEKPVVVKTLERKLEPHLNKIEFRGVKFGWSLLIWNLITFFFSLLACSVGQIVGWGIWGIYKKYRNKYMYLRHKHSNMQYSKAITALSRIPVMVKPTLMRASDTILTNLEASSKMNIEKSCPNLLMRRSGSNLSSLTDFNGRACRTLFRQDLYLSKQAGMSPESQLETQCQRLKDELHRQQTSSLKEHALLSRKVENVNKAKKEMEKQLIVMQKENRAAKQQLEELVQEKAALLKKLENATKEFKTNTKTKKYALAKLEEVTTNVEELRQQLEQVTRDKEILEKKLGLLEVEYNKLHDRYISAQKLSITRSQDDNLPERDENNKKFQNPIVEKLHFGAINNESILQKTANALTSVSQTELDMKLIQEKIKQLERNLENLNINSDGIDCYRAVEQLESDVSFTGIDATSDSQQRLGDGSLTTLSGYSSTNSPRPKFWTEKVAELIGNNRNQFAKIQALANQMQEKAKFLGGIKRQDDESTAGDESSQSEEREPKRLVSSSIAFKNFLKSLNGLDKVNKPIPYQNGRYA